nr:immunoglobulin light chain junction region [Macaca mulatta]
CLQGHTTPFTF